MIEIFKQEPERECADVFANRINEWIQKNQFEPKQWFVSSDGQTVTVIGTSKMKINQYFDKENKTKVGE